MESTTVTPFGRRRSDCLVAKPPRGRPVPAEETPAAIDLLDDRQPYFPDNYKIEEYVAQEQHRKHMTRLAVLNGLLTMIVVVVLGLSLWGLLWWLVPAAWHLLRAWWGVRP
jgi:hypothetical protein